MSYPGSSPNNPLNGEGSLTVVGAIIMGPNGPMTQQYLGHVGSTIMGDTTGPNSVNPSGTPSGIRLATQNNFRSRTR